MFQLCHLQWKNTEDIDILNLRSLGLIKFYSGQTALYWNPILQGLLVVLFSTVYDGPRPPSREEKLLLPLVFIAPIIVTLPPLPVSIPVFLS